MKPVFITIGFLLSTAISAFCADFYVSTAGSDSNPGTQAQPFATIQHAIDMCPYTGVASTVHLDGSTWNESPTLEAQNEAYSSSDRPTLTLVGDYNGPNGMGGRDTSIINGCLTLIAISDGVSECHAAVSSITAKQMLADTAATIAQGVTYIVIGNCIINNSPSHGISCHPDALANYYTFQQCIITNCNGDGIHTDEGSGIPWFSLIHDCDIFNNQGIGIHLIKSNMFFSKTNNNEYIRDCYNNNIYSNGSNGIYFSDSCSNAYNNSIQNNQAYGVYCTGSSCNPDLGGGAQSSSGNNTISGNGTYEVYNDSPNNIYAKNNHWDDQSEGEMAGGYYNTVNVTRIWDHWENSSKGYIMWSDPAPTRTAAPSIGMLKATFYPSSNIVNHIKARCVR